MALEILVNTGSGNGLLLDSTKPLPEPMLICHQWVPVCPHQRSISQEVFKISIHILIMNLKHTRLTHWGQAKHICISNLTIIGSDNGLLPGRRQAIIWANAGILLNRPLGTNFSDILIAIYILSFKKTKFKQWSEKWQPFCLSLNVLKLLPHLPGENELIFLTWITISSIPRIITAAWNTSVHTTARIPPWKFTHKWGILKKIYWKSKFNQLIFFDPF